MNPLVIIGAAVLGGALLLVTRRASASVNPSPEVSTVPKSARTRGERNNNPGNLRDSTTRWRGETGDNTDTAFEEFKTPEDGIRALALLLLNYQRHYGLRTLRQIISRYAPPSENDTEAYIRGVALHSGFGASTPLNLSDADSLRAVVRAVIIQENGRVIYSDVQLRDGILQAMV